MQEGLPHVPLFDIDIATSKVHIAGQATKITSLKCTGTIWTVMDYHGLTCTNMNYVSWTIMDYHGLSWTTMDYHGLSWTIMDYHLLLQAGHKIGFDIGNGREITGFLSIFNDQDHVEDC